MARACQVSMCEKCWGDAYLETLMRGGSQTEHYKRLIEERRDSPCTPKEQAGQWWDEALQKDSRK